MYHGDMTSLSLLLWIVSGIALQLAIYLGAGVWRRWNEYQDLPSRGGALDSANQEGTVKAKDTDIELWQGFRAFRVDRKVVEDATGAICSFYLVPEDGKPLPPFLPGQFLTFRLDVPMATAGREQIIRCYSLSEAPSPDCYRVSIKRVPSLSGSDFPPGRSSNYFHDHVAVGSVLQVRAPSGHFHIDRSDAPVVLIGGGIGITPMLSMLNWCLANQPGREIWLFYGVRNNLELAMKPHLDALASANANFHLRVCASNPLQNEVAGRDYQHHGRIDIQLLRAQLPLKPYHFYICGPGPLMETLVPALEDWGVPDECIHFEAFGPASIKRRVPDVSVATTRPATTNADIVVNFALSGKQLPWQPSSGSLLEFAEANGVAVNSGCRAGSCGTCQTTLRAGEVIYRQPPDFDPQPDTCLLCVCTPKTSLTLEV